MSGQKIIDGLKEAHAGGLTRVRIDGEVWVRATDLHADQQEIMRINNQLRLTLIEIRDGFGPNHLSRFCREKAIDAIGGHEQLTRTKEG